ncbi:GDSL esterase/lipase EXL3 [Rhynchospora pubera]|uniref:GDSL esterase/lipase EXL3 n=1 Tax=Rhynchospora pubera TaxID=906938 RepID=A0AAV8E865_9POAL|nr:GDSL esterase/lipase EXL3 [Rhynchospora pubera]
MQMAVNFLYIIFLHLVTVVVFQSNATPEVPALIVFGDSIVDPGNNNGLKSLAKCNFPPYGRDFEGQSATGRFSNGKIPTDFIASQVGIKEYLPAYLDPELSDEDLLTGVSFASGGAGFDNITAKVASSYTLWDQLQMFEEYKRKLESVAGIERAAEIVKDSVYIIVAGSNDIMVTYFISNLRSNYDIPSYVDYIVQAASSFIKNLYNLGVRKIGIVGVPPLGCVPMVRTIRGGITRECVEIYNQASVLLNRELSAELTRLAQELPSSQIIYLDVYNILHDLIMNSSHYGFEEATRGCCGTGKVEATLLCNEELSTLTCQDTSKYLFWDAFHPTERAYELLVTPLVKNYLPILF